MRSHQLYLLIYMALVLLFVGLLLTRDTLFSFWSIRASTKLHNTLFSRVLSAPVLFFLRTPVGDVLNAFARDQVRSCSTSRVLAAWVCVLAGLSTVRS
jgi:ABC-type bacteriocin/lantibiotic exporter with double-glycine peptidase domain